MTLEPSTILEMTASQKADTFADGAKQMIAGRYRATIALALLERSNGYLDLGFKSVKELAAKRSRLDPREVSELLWAGRKLLEIPELNEAYRDQRLNWTKVRTLIPHIRKEDAAELIAKATKMSSHAFALTLENHRDPSVGGPTHALILSLPGYRRFALFANGLRLEASEKNLPDEECLWRLLDEVEAGREAKRSDRASGTSGASATTAAVQAATAPVTAPPADAEAVVPVAEGATRSRHIPAAIRRRVMNRARHACEICRNRYGLKVHHAKIPFRAGGPHSAANLMAACHRCHVKVHREERRDATPPTAAD